MADEFTEDGPEQHGDRLRDPGPADVRGRRLVAMVSPGARAQTLADRDEIVADQTSADGDHTGGDRDQRIGDHGPWVSDRDQDASDRDVAAGVGGRVHDLTREIGRRGERRSLTRSARLDGAPARDAAARARDVVALQRDQDAVVRDLLMAGRDIGDEVDDSARMVTGAEVVMRAAATRRRAADRRVQAAEQRAYAAADREAAAADRVLAAHERDAARTDREEHARQLEIAETDALTGARSRAPGLHDLERELARCRRTGTPLVVAYVDLVGLKAVNDTLGHAHGDALLIRAVTVMRSRLRPYDLVIRLGSDGFLCVMSQITPADARRRLGVIAATLAEADPASAIRTGFADLQPDDSATTLIARADRELTTTRHTAERLGSLHAP